MTVSLRYYECDDFPEMKLGNALKTSVQTSLQWDNPSASTEVTYLGVAEHQAFERYSVVHQVEREIDAFWQQNVVTTVLENRRFIAYYDRTSKYFLVRYCEPLLRFLFSLVLPSLFPP